MNAHVYLSEDEMIQRALEALMEALGPVETTRFVTMPRQRRIESVERHRQWQAKPGSRTVLRSGLRSSGGAGHSVEAIGIPCPTAITSANCRPTIPLVAAHSMSLS